MLDERLRHAATEARRVAEEFNRTDMAEQGSQERSRRVTRRLVAAGAVVAIIGVTWFAIGPMQDDGGPAGSGPPTIVSEDPYVVQVPDALSPEFSLPGGARDIPLLSIDQYLASDASYIRSFIVEADEITAVGRTDDDTHRIFLVAGRAAKDLTSDSPQPEGARATCIIDTAGKSGSCGTGDESDTGPVFGLAAGGGTDDGSEFAVLMGTVPESTSVVVVTTPEATYWQFPRGDIAFLAVEVSFDRRSEIGWQFLDTTGSSIGAPSRP